MATANRPHAITAATLASGSALELARSAGEAPRRLEPPGAGPILELARVRDVLYVPRALEPGQGLQVLEAGVVPIEAVNYEFTAGFVAAQLEARGVASFDDFEDSALERDACILGNLFSRNFTHWHEELMKVVVLEHAGIDCCYVLSELPAFARELLLLIGIPEERILEVRAPTRFRHALYTTSVSYIDASAHPGVLLALRERLLAATAGVVPGVGERLWLDRGSQARLGRKLVNVDEVHALLDRRGFRRVDMGGLPVREQLALARDARVMAGLHGSQFVHSQLMPPRSAVIECFSPLYLNPTYTEIYRVLRHRYSQLGATNTPVFPYPHGGDVEVDLQQLALALETLDAG
jgi:capsular polysaccharide biosynthesis protein